MYSKLTLAFFIVGLGVATAFQIKSCEGISRGFFLLETFRQCTLEGMSEPCIEGHAQPETLGANPLFQWYVNNLCCNCGCNTNDFLHFCCKEVIQKRIPGLPDDAF